MMTTLRKALADGKLDQFIAERDSDAPGDDAAFNRALEAMAGKSKEAPAASRPRRSGD